MRLKRKHFISGKTIAVDTETTGVNVWHGDEPFMFGFCNMQGDTEIFEWAVDPYTRCVIYDWDEVEEIRRFMEDPKIIKVFWNAKFDVRMIENALGIKTCGVIHDAMFMAHQHNSLELQFGLKPLSEKWLGYPKEDVDLLQKATVKARNQGKKRGWMLGTKWKKTLKGEWDKESAVKADYWMDKILNPQSTLCADYCRGDVERTILMYRFYKKSLTHYEQWPVYEREMALWPVTYAIETRGVRVDLDVVDKEAHAFMKEAKKQYEYLVKASGRADFNPNSNPHKIDLVYGKLGLPVIRRTDKGNPQVSIDALLDHIMDPTVNALFRYGAVKNGLVNFFFKYQILSVPDSIIPGGRALHPDLNQVGPATGRFSCRTPNLQNVANDKTSRSPMPIQARGPFGPRDGCVWFPVDYSQLEARIFADVAQETHMLEAIANRDDLHTMITNKAWGGEGNQAMLNAATHALELDGTGGNDLHPSSELETVWARYGIDAKFVKAWGGANMSTNEKDDIVLDWMKGHKWDIVSAESEVGKKISRSRGKTIQFLKLFGGGPGAAAIQLMCSKRQAARFLSEFDRAFPRVNEYSRELSEQAEIDGYIVNRFGRKLTVDRRFSYRAVNYMVQGSAADLLKHVMINCHRYLKETGLDAHMVLVVHDEIIFEFLKRHAFKPVLRQLCRIMEDHGGAFGVDTPVEIDVARHSWNEKKGIDIGEWRQVA